LSFHTAWVETGPTNWGQRAHVIAPLSVSDDGNWHERASNRNLEQPHGAADVARALRRERMTMTAAAFSSRLESMKQPPLDFSPMPSTEYVGALDQDPQVSAAAVFGLSPRLSRYYASGGYPVPLALAALLRLMGAGRYSAEQIAKARR
jgi:hypothetical protein